MKGEFKINRAWRYTLLCAISGGFFGFIMAASWFPSGAYLFGISVFLGVGSMARLGHRMNLNEEQLYEKKTYALSALFVGLTSHLSSFLLFGILMYISGDASIYGVTTLGECLKNALGFGFLSTILFFWFSIPLYLVTGFIAKRFDDQECKEKGIVDYPRVQIQEVYNEKLDFQQIQLTSKKIEIMKGKMNHAWMYTLINSMGGAIVGFIMALWAFNESALVFGLSVFLGVAIVARLYHYGRMRDQTELTVKNYKSGAVSIGLLSHFTSFFIYVFLESYVMPDHGGFLSMSGRGVGEMLGTSLFFSVFSMVFLSWLSIPLYMLMGFILRKIESKESAFDAELDMVSEEK